MAGIAPATGARPRSIREAQRAPRAIVTPSAARRVICRWPDGVGSRVDLVPGQGPRYHRRTRILDPSPRHTSALAVERRTATWQPGDCRVVRANDAEMACGAPTMTYPSLFCLFLAAMGAVAENSTVAGQIRRRASHPPEPGLRVADPRGCQSECDGRGGVPGGRRVRLATGVPLVRIGGENVYRRRENLDYTVPDGFAGSILNLRPGTEYECRFRLTDPDGASGQTEHTVRVKTRSEPQPSREGVRCTSIPRTIRARDRSQASRACCKPTTAPAWATGASSGNGGRGRAIRS